MEAGVVAGLILLGTGMGLIACWAIMASRRAAAIANAVAQAQAPFVAEQARLEERSLRVPTLETECARLAKEASALRAELAQLGSRAEAEARHFDEKLKLLTTAREELSNQFKSLANDILEEKSKRFKQENEASLGQILEPLKLRINDFRAKVEEVYVQEGKDRSALAGQVQQLVELNQALSQDARNLTLALKGSSKAQGNWGELILERVLEASGLRKDFEYIVQVSQCREDGSRAQPDVVINLPEDRKLIVDAKVSLTAYERYVAAESESERALHLRQHLESVRGHIRGLSERKYEAIYGIKSLDFVLAFVPVEPAFMMAVTNDEDLFMDAWRQNVLLVSPSTLLFVVRTVAHLWRQEVQKTNAQEIAKRGAELYDKLCGFVEDLVAVGNRLGQAQKAYEGAHAKLATGRGNVIRQAEMLRELGVKASKALPAPVLDLAMAEDDVVLLNALAKAAGDEPSEEQPLPLEAKPVPAN